MDTDMGRATSATVSFAVDDGGRPETLAGASEDKKDNAVVRDTVDVSVSVDADPDAETIA